MFSTHVAQNRKPAVWSYLRILCSFGFTAVEKAGEDGSPKWTIFELFSESSCHTCHKPELAGFNPIGPLAHLGLARAYSSQGDTAKAREAYQDFLALWKDADPDPIALQ